MAIRVSRMAISAKLRIWQEGFHQPLHCPSLPYPLLVYDLHHVHHVSFSREKVCHFVSGVPVRSRGYRHTKGWFASSVAFHHYFYACFLTSQCPNLPCQQFRYSYCLYISRSQNLLLSQDRNPRPVAIASGHLLQPKNGATLSS